MTKFDAYHKMKELLTNYYIEAKTTKEKPIAWITSGAPVEFLYAMDVLPVYPENYAAMCAANHQSIELMESADSEGFSQDICAYALTDFGADPVLHYPAYAFFLDPLGIQHDNNRVTDPTNNALEPFWVFYDRDRNIDCHPAVTQVHHVQFRASATFTAASRACWVVRTTPPGCCTPWAPRLRSCPLTWC